MSKGCYRSDTRAFQYHRPDKKVNPRNNSFNIFTSALKLNSLHLHVYYL